jgi:Protein of unknown function (DUF3617)
MRVPPGDLAQLPPAARAQAEATMKRAATNRNCLTAEDLRELNLSKTDDEDCKVTSKKVTGTTADITMTCTGDKPRTQTMHDEMLSRESMRGTIKTTSASGPSDLTITGKWIGAVCKEGQRRTRAKAIASANEHGFNPSLEKILETGAGLEAKANG